MKIFCYQICTSNQHDISFTFSSERQLVIISRFLQTNMKHRSPLSADDVNTPIAKRRRMSLDGEPSHPDHLEDGEVASDDSLDEEIIDVDELEDDSAEEGELTIESERAAIDSQVNRDLSGAAVSVAQKDARYFTLSSVVCSHCGIKGHMSYTCTEKDEERCFLCGKGGHIARDCPSNDFQSKRKTHRPVGSPREPLLRCYVCKERGHLDCSIGQWKGVLSCYNCGMVGHGGTGCNMPNVARVMPIVKGMENERKDTPRGQRNRKSGANGDPKAKEALKLREATDFRDELKVRLRQKRYGHKSNHQR